MSDDVTRPTRLVHFCLLAVLAALLGYASPRELPFVGVAETWLYDVRLGLITPARPQHDDIVLVTVTEETMAMLPYRSPLNRDFLAGAITAIAAKGAAAIGIDYIFDQQTAPDSDLRLKTALANSRVPVVVGMAGSETPLTEVQSTFQKAFLAGLNPGLLNLTKDKDQTVRRTFPGETIDGNWIPGLAAAMASAMGVEPPRVSVPLQYYPRQDAAAPPFKTFPAHAVAVLPEPWIKDKIVLFGPYLPWDDRHPTPFTAAGLEGVVPGLEIHAYALAQYLEGAHVTPVSASVEAVIVLLAAVSAVWLITLGWPPIAKWGCLVVLLVAYWAGAVYAYQAAAQVYPLVSPTLALAMASGFNAVYLGYEERKQKSFIRDAFSRYVSHNLVDEIVNNPERLDLDGERRHLTFAFTDLAGFTSLAEKLDPGDLVSLLNGYIEGMCSIAFRHDGTIDKIVGDAVVVYWGAPLDQEDQRDRAVACALEMDAFSEDYRKKNVTKAGELGITRIGVNSGVAIVGNFGGGSFFDYTAHGDMVNTAARLEGANKYLGTRICVGEETALKCTNITFRPVAALYLKGKNEAIRVFEPLEEDSPARARLAEYLTAYEILEAGDDNARRVFTELAESDPDDPVYRFHQQRLNCGENGTEVTLSGK